LRKGEIPKSERGKCGAVSPLILKKAVTSSNAPTAEALSQRGLDLLAAGAPHDAVEAFRAAIAANAEYAEAHHGLVRALRDAGRLEESIGAALALAALTPSDPLAHTALSISLQHAGHVPEAEAAAARARILEWKMQLESPQEAAPAQDREQ
jgi:tetratricopeptide (TPR) repeat protein